MSRTDLFIVASLIASMSFCAWVKYPIADEEDPAYREAVSYSKKSSAHMESTEFLWECIDRPGKGPTDCENLAIGKATSEKGGVYGMQVKEAIEDTKGHMRDWLQAHPIQGGLLSKLSDKAIRIYR